MDIFKQGAVIRWVMLDKYTYVAVKAGPSWYTSAVKQIGPDKASVPQVVGTKDFFRILASKDASKVEVAVTWEEFPV